MTHQQASARCAELNRGQHRDRRWFVRKAGPDDWELVSVAIPGMRPAGPFTEVVESRPQPDPDPRPAIIRNIPPYGPAG